jgi:modulator of FtsH protease
VHIRFRQYRCRRREADSITIFEALEAWKDLLVATAGASAALAGLVTVAIATNIGEILKFPWLPSRAATSIALLVLVLVVSIAGLMRPQSLFWFGVETVAFAALTWLITARTAWIRLATRRVHERPVPQLAQEIGLYQIGVLPFVVGGVLLLTDDTNGMYWLAGGMIAAVVVSMLTTWVLLIEVLR